MAAAASLKRLSRMTPEELKELFGLAELPSSYKDLDPQKLPFEELEAFSCDGLNFEDAANQLWKHVSIMHYHAGTYNRHSEWYPIACAQLEKDIRMMGSFCLTKAVLEKRGFQFPSLKHMDIKELYGVTCFHFRKCGKAFDDLYATTGLISIPLHQWELRWYSLGERLKATDQKIQKILDGKIKIDDLPDSTEENNAEKTLNTGKTEKQAKPLVLRYGALPLIGSYARQMTQERKIEAHLSHIDKRFKKLNEKRARLNDAANLAKAKKHPKEKAGSSEGSQHQSESVCQTRDENTSTAMQQEIKQTGLTIPELRANLLKKAEQRGEGTQIMQIAGDPPDRLLERWKRYRQEDEKQHPAAGGSGHNRKKRKRR